MANHITIRAVVYPFLPEHAERIFSGKDIVVKYLPHPHVAYNKGAKLLIYISHSAKNIVGEATIQDIDFLPVEKLLKEYRNRLFLNEDELMKYSASQPGRVFTKPLLVLKILNIRRFKKPIVLPFSPTMAGRYLSNEMYQQIIRALA
ncbi:MAG: DUF365 domain-containing protein [Nitrososphaerota archaeon]|jgi:hypothetical protein|nr:DUF365 domain-containing protein [Nitrososphaerota archaeon]MDG7039164.1 DUF365 domain-containing protein [Nitrososphaerota archaeon]MDG7040735.1 DUF365 domain-containing protein [Nitrososphaerota archaeon]